MRWLAIVGLCGGCLVLPHTTTTSSTHRMYSPPVEGPVGPIELDLVTAKATVRVTARRSRTCHQQITNVTVTRTKSEAELGGDIGNDPSSALIALVLAPVTLPLSAIITGIVVSLTDKSTSSSNAREATSYACGLPARRVAVQLALPSGATLDGETDEHGRVIFAVPITEPDEGVVIAHAGPVASTTSYSRTEEARSSPIEVPTATADPDAKAFASIRAVLRDCGATHAIHGLVDAQLAIADSGHVTADPDGGGAEFVACVRTELAEVRFPLHHPRRLLFPQRY